MTDQLRSSRSSAARRAARRRAVIRRRRLTVGLVVVALVLVGLAIADHTGGSPARGHSSRQSSRAANPARDAASRPTPAPVTAVEAGLMPWSLSVPLSRMAAYPATGSGVVIAGGLTPGQSSADGVYLLNTSSGAVGQISQLTHGVHDASGAVVNGSDMVFGGGDPSTVATVQSIAGAADAAAGPSTVSGALPSPRSDSAAAAVGATTYIVGGYDGTNPDPEVLATSDGRTFTPVASLPVPVRYPAVAAHGGYVYVFGGEAIGGAAAGTGPVDVIQRIDPANHKALIVGHMPYPLEAAAAVNLGGTIYVAGGESTSPHAGTAGVGTTQLGGWASASIPPTAGVAPVGDVWAFVPATDTVDRAGQLQVPVSHAGVVVQGGSAWLIGGESGSSMVGTVQWLRPNPAFGIAGTAGAGSPYYGTQLLVADRGNDRLLLMDPAMNVRWTYPNATSPADPLGFYFPDDAFFAKRGSIIISNQEQNETILEIAYPSGNIVWSYGHPKVSGTATGYLYEPDDAYLLRNGQISVADADNCRVLVINSDHTVASQIGTDGQCVHDPPSSMGSPNGDTPLWDGNLLVSEINGSWVSEYTPTGHLAWTVQLPIAYPSDPQQLGASATINADRYLVADYTQPGKVLQFTREGQILATYEATSGPGMLNHPSLAEELPNGIYLINDDYNDRMVAIDPSNGALLWQYGLTGQPGTGPGQLNTPDGFDLLGPGGTTPTHPQTG